MSPTAIPGADQTFHCHGCNYDFTAALTLPDRGPFSIGDDPAIFFGPFRGRAEDGVFIAEAATCLYCRQLALPKATYDLITSLGWTQDAEAAGTVNITVQGSVSSERDLAEALRHALRRPPGMTPYTAFKR